jgi:CBS domain-containing protein
MTLFELALSPVPSVPSDTSACKAVEALRRFRSGALVVTDGGRLAGLLSEWDLVHRVVGEGRDPRSTTVGDVMTRNPATANPETSMDAAFELMIARRVRHLVLIDDAGRPVGLVPLRVLAKAQMGRAADTIQILQDQSNDALGG